MVVTDRERARSTTCCDSTRTGRRTRSLGPAQHRLHAAPGVQRTGQAEKPTAEVLARANDGGRNGKPLLVRIDASDKGRVLAFGASDTWLWTQPGKPKKTRGIRPADLHARFWKQMVLWLAHQDEVEGNVYVRPEFRRLVVNGRQTVRMGIRDKRGDEVPEADAQVPDGRPRRGSRTRRRRSRPSATRRAAAARRSRPRCRASIASSPGAKGPIRTARRSPTTRRPGTWSTRKSRTKCFGRRPTRSSCSPWRTRPTGRPWTRSRRADRLPEFLEEMKADPPKVAHPEAEALPRLATRQAEVVPAGGADPVRGGARPGVGPAAGVGDGLSGARVGPVGPM